MVELQGSFYVFDPKEVVAMPSNNTYDTYKVLGRSKEVHVSRYQVIGDICSLVCIQGDTSYLKY